MTEVSPFPDVMWKILFEWPLRSRGRRRETSWRLPTGRLSVNSKAEVDYKTDRDEVPTNVIPECVNQGGS